MRYRVEQIKLNLDEALAVNNSARAIKVENRLAVLCSEDILAERIARKIGGKKLSPRDIKNIEIVRRSIDARGEETIFVYTLDFECEKKLNLKEAEHHVYQIGAVKTNAARPVVVGFGPCGMFAALVLARAGLKPIVVERGSEVDIRTSKVKEFWDNKKLDPECNVQFGEGGAGTFSDGKLNTGIKDKRIRFVLETLVDAGASVEILVDARPHVGTDILRTVVKRVRKEIISLGGEILFDTKLVGIETVPMMRRGENAAINAREKTDDRNYLRAINAIYVERNPDCGANNGAEKVVSEIKTDALILALGHSARDTLRMLYDNGLAMEAKPFSMGVRVQHGQELIDRATYGKDYGHPALPPAYYKLSHRAEDGRGVYSFCMCPGGEIVNAASHEGGVVTNGMSNAKRDSGFANSGILVDVRLDDYKGGPLSGMLLQEKYEQLAFVNGGSDYSLPSTDWKSYAGAMEGVPNDAAEKVIASLPSFVARDIYEAMTMFGKKIKGFDQDDTLMVAIESRSSSPVRMVRDSNTLEGILQTGLHNVDRSVHAASQDSDDATSRSIISGLYPGGEGAGYAGGITSAACDGIKIAEKIIDKYKSEQ